MKFSGDFLSCPRSLPAVVPLFLNRLIEYKKTFSGFCATTKLINYIQIHSANLPVAEDDESTDDVNKLPLTAHKQKDFCRLQFIVPISVAFWT